MCECLNSVSLFLCTCIYCYCCFAYYSHSGYICAITINYILFQCTFPASWLFLCWFYRNWRKALLKLLFHISTADCPILYSSGILLFSDPIRAYNNLETGFHGD